METLINNSPQNINIATVSSNFFKYVYEFDSIGISDYEFSDSDIRVYVDFDYCWGKLAIKSIEILDSEWDQIRSIESLQLENEIRNVVAGYNRSKLTDEEKYNELEHLRSVMFSKN